MQVQFPAIKLDFPRAKPLRLVDVGAPMPDFRAPIIGNVVVSTVDEQIAASFSSVDWDGEDDPEFATPNEVTRSVARGLANRIVRRLGRPAPMPRFAAAPDGGISLHWRSARLEILIVVPPDPQSKIEFYGDTPTGDVIEGSFSGAAQAESIADWIAEYEFPG